VTEAGQIVTVGGHTWWHCANAACRQKLGEIIGPRLVIRLKGVQLSLSVAADPECTCPRCGTLNAMRQEVAS